MSGADYFLLFFAIFWGGVLNSAAPYRPFDTAATINGGWSAFRRLGLAIVFLNILPLAYIAYAYILLQPVKGVSGVVSGALASFAIFGFYRIFAGLVIGLRRRLFDQNPPANGESSELNEFEGDPRVAPSVKRTWYAHLIGGVFYAAVAPSLAYLVLSVPFFQHILCH